MKVFTVPGLATWVDLETAELHNRAAITHAAILAARGVASGVVVAGSGNLMVWGTVEEAALIRALNNTRAVADAQRHVHTINVVYNGEDLAPVAAACGLTVSQLVSLHSNATYDVDVLGFQPGFAYLTGLHPRLHLPRRPAPRPSVPALSVAIAGGMTGVYPRASPGGWHLLGHAIDVKLFDPESSPPGLLQPGQRVRFVPVEGASAPCVEATRPQALTPSGGLHVIRALGCITVQDAGRPHGPALGVPVGGAWDVGTLAAANAAVGNAAECAAVEVWLGRLTATASASLVCSVNGREAQRLSAGDTLEVDTTRDGVAYVAVAGGIDAPLLMGSRSTLVSSGVGGAVIRRGHVLQVGTQPGFDGGANPPADKGPATLEVLPGPHAAGSAFGPGALEQLVHGPYTLSPLSNRVGLRLAGPPVLRMGADSLPPVPTVPGAIQVTTDGTPIILGPEHPVTGGYPLLAVVAPGTFPALAQLVPGQPVRMRFAR